MSAAPTKGGGGSKAVNLGFRGPAPPSRRDFFPGFDFAHCALAAMRTLRRQENRTKYSPVLRGTGVFPAYIKALP